MSLGVVKNLRAGSAAAAAGVKEGDQIVTAPDLVTAKDSDDRPLKLDVKRGEQRLTISYIPRGAAVPAWRWERTADAAKGACKL
jgi:predicted metalloprotease with PDZ domain